MFLLDYLAEYGPLSLDQLAGDVGFDHPLALQIVEELLRGGLVYQELLGGRWAISDAGKWFLNGTVGSSDKIDLSVLLHRWHEGDQAAGEEIFRQLMPELQRIAARLRNRERRNYSLQAGELVNEMFLELIEANQVTEWRDVGHFLAIYTIKLRRFLIAQARKDPTPKLMSIEDLPEGVMAGRNRLEVRLAVDQLLDELEKESPTTCGILVARIYFGYEVKEIMTNFNLPQRTVERHLYQGRKWLVERLTRRVVAPVTTDPPERDDRVMTLAAETIKKPTDKRQRFLLEACQRDSDSDLYRDVSEVVSWEERMGSFLQRPLIEFMEINPQ